MSAARLTACVRYKAVRPAPSPWPYNAAMPIIPTETTTSATRASMRPKPCCRCSSALFILDLAVLRARSADRADHGVHERGFLQHLGAARAIDPDRTSAGEVAGARASP